jgi:Lon protease-like protein
MFPLSSVLFPGAVLPLQIFESRYMTMLSDITASDRRFGVVLIERGSEAGGGDQRFDVGTVARLARLNPMEQGRVGVLVVGAERFRVINWLPDDPYPRAMAVVLEDEPVVDAALLDEAVHALRRLYAFASELGAVTGPVPEDADPDELMWALCAVAPVSQIDRQRLLEADAADQRLVLLTDLLREEAGVLEKRLAMG